MNGPREKVRATVEIAGTGLFSGASCVVRLARAEGPVRVVLGGAAFSLGDLELRGTERRVVVGRGASEVALIEHLLAALGGLGVHDGVRIEVQGPELPLLDGGASAWCDALASIGAPRGSPSLVVAREGEVRDGESHYAFRPSDETSIDVTIDFGLAWLAPHARWDGDPIDFRERIATARTFVLAREIEALIDRGLSAHADPASIVVLDAEGVRAMAPCAPDEPARHKLLDLVGDLALHGGPPLGVVRASRPGHAATHRAVRAALAQGILITRSRGV